MQEKSNNHLAGDYSGEAAATYHERRFESSGRMRKLHAMETSFANNLQQIVGSDAVVIDIPCGSGRFTNLLSAFKYLYSMDLSQDMLTEAENAAPEGLNGEFVLASATEIPLDDKSVDLAFCMRLLHHIAEPDVRKQILSELYRVSRRWVATSFYRKESYRFYKKRLLGKKVSGQPISISQFEQEALECGLRLVDINPKKPMAYFNASAQTVVLLEKVAQ